MFVISTLATISAFVGNFLLNSKKIQGFYLWIFSNFAWIYVIYFTKPVNWPILLQSFGFFTMNCHGIYKWSKK